MLTPTQPSDSPAQRIIEVLLRGGPMTVAELAGELNVTATAVRQQLSRLVSEGWLLRTHRNSGPGRPAGVFAVAEKARRLFGAGGPDVSRLLIEEIVRVDGEGKARALLERVSRRIAEAAKPAVGQGPPAERIRRLADYLSHEGVMAESESRGTRLSVFTCPYAGIVEEHREICEMEREAFSALVEQSVEQHQCMLDGHSACEFELAAPNGAAEARDSKPAHAAAGEVSTHADVTDAERESASRDANVPREQRDNGL